MEGRTTSSKAEALQEEEAAKSEAPQQEHQRADFSKGW